MIACKCHACGTALSVPDSFAGKEHPCPNPNCGKMISVLINPLDELTMAVKAGKQQNPVVGQIAKSKPPGQTTCDILFLLGWVSFLGGIAGLVLCFVVPYSTVLLASSVSSIASSISLFFASAVLANLMRITTAVEDRKKDA